MNLDKKFGAAEEEQILWRANFEEFIRDLRHKVDFTIKFPSEHCAITPQFTFFFFFFPFEFLHFLVQILFDLTNEKGN